MRADSGTTQGVERQPSPYQEPLRTWAGHGSGATCNGCGDSIREHEIEYEIELPQGGSVPTLHFHFVCYRTWTGRGAR
ncbi:MAG: hypothetical protein ACREVV_01305 [Steroidobacteraceae bacterium]